MDRVDLIYFDAGGGHQAAATALAVAIREQKMPWNVRLSDLAPLLGREVDHSIRHSGGAARIAAGNQRREPVSLMYRATTERAAVDSSRSKWPE